MDGTPKFEATERTQSGAPVACEILAPAQQSVPFVFASPHSGANYPDAFVAASRLDPVSLRRSEDSFVDEFFIAAPTFGAPLLRALFPRAFVDPNREPYELDPEMFEGALPDYVNTTSPRVAGGLGTVARVVTTGAEIYRDKLDFAEAVHRVETYYRPYHQALERLIGDTRKSFGACILIDCHSMPSVGGPMDRDPGAPRVDFVLGDRHGSSCSPELLLRVERLFEKNGFVVARNAPYAGGFTTAHYGRPADGVHALQIEINRALYMDEAKVEQLADFARLQTVMHGIVGELCQMGLAAL